MSSSDVELQENKRDKLFSAVMKGKWLEVIEMYKQERDVRTVEITTRDNVIHMAALSGDAKVVANIVDFECEERDIVLRAGNDRKNTPLHFAASMGNVEICRKIGGADSLVTMRNIAGETPLFLAAFHGKKQAFLWLHYLYMESPGASSTNHRAGASSTDHPYWRRNNEDTILHCAIAEGHIDVIIEIVYLYKDHLRKMMMPNKEGLTPLHILAAKRLAFKSTDLLDRSILVRPFYWLFRVKKKKQAMTKKELEQCERKLLVRVIIWVLIVLQALPIALLIILQALPILPSLILFIVAGALLATAITFAENHCVEAQIARPRFPCLASKLFPFPFLLFVNHREASFSASQFAVDRCVNSSHHHQVFIFSVRMSGSSFLFEQQQ
ncbi:uncharacterized protein LOC129313889 [Prosopis cineraria]|uniref:uncharacterized protein LOC129313889 n=1 Tax=Prosopis cineraria TaxID=364024 RepID=UPI00240EED46|nr:uncharacterized protein LOC129313889 [Prosopis cineraria]